MLHVEYSFNQPPSVDAGPDQAITVPDPVNLDGTVSDDGVPGPLKITWSKISGPGTVTFANASAAATTASFSVAGDYVLRLTAYDGEHTTTGDVNIKVEVGNQPPQVKAGANQTITLPAVATLNGTVIDDGQPDPPGTVSTIWTKATGPGSVGFGDKSSVDTTVSFTVPGFYVLRLSADDSALAADAQVTITVRAEGDGPTPGLYIPQVLK